MYENISKERVFICNTVYQLIVAIRIHMSIKGESYLVVTNQINNILQISERIKDTELFKKVIIGDVKTNKSSARLIKECIWGANIKELDDLKIDELICFNFDIFSHSIYAQLFKNNRNIVINKMEEGLLSYNTPTSTCRVLKVSNTIRKILGKQSLREQVEGFYCFLPTAYRGALNTIQISRISQNDLEIRRLLNHIFILQKIEPYKEKFIFLSCIYDIEGGNAIGELALAKRIADYVGSDNFIVKVHPRDDKQKYIEAGLKVDRNSDIPWEVVQINLDFSNKTLITTLSGSILNFNPVLETVPKSYYGYNMCQLNGNHLASHYKCVLENYLSNDSLGLRNIQILESFEEL